MGYSLPATDLCTVQAQPTDLDKPWKVIAEASPYLISPQTLYECVGDVPNVVFPCAALVDSATGRLALYYGGADTVTAVAFGYVQEIVQFVKRIPSIEGGRSICSRFQHHKNRLR